MLQELLGGLIDKEKAIYDTIQDALSDVAEELKCDRKDFFIMIRPMDDQFNHRFFICKYNEDGNPVNVREITLKEIMS
jgi:hypothetical protein